MISAECAAELRSAWLPNLTDPGLDRIIELLENRSPFLIHGCFTKAASQGCLASHAAWHHPRTAHLTQDAGISWLHCVAGLNPATSRVLRMGQPRREPRFAEGTVEAVPHGEPDSPGADAGLARESVPACV